MEVPGELVGLIGVVIGVLATEFSGYMRMRREDRRLYRTVLSELLEVRHRFLIAPAGFRRDVEALGFPPEAVSVAGEFLAPLVSGGDDLQERFNRAVDDLRQLEPVLAYRLRSKDAGAIIAALLRGLSAEHTAPPEVLKLVEIVSGDIQKDIDIVCRTLADKIGGRVPDEVDEVLSRRTAVPRGVKRLLKQVVRRFAAEVRADGTEK